MSPMSEQGKRILENLQRLDVEERSVVGLPYAWEVCSSLTGWGARVEVDIPTADFVDPDMEVVGRRKLVLNPDLRRSAGRPASRERAQGQGPRATSHSSVARRGDNQVKNVNKVLEPGDVVAYYDEKGQKHNALVTAVHDGLRDEPQPWGGNSAPRFSGMLLADAKEKRALEVVEMQKEREGQKAVDYWTPERVAEYVATERRTVNSVNLLYLDPHPGASQGYGRQHVQQGSVSHHSAAGTVLPDGMKGRCWDWLA